MKRLWIVTALFLAMTACSKPEAEAPTEAQEKEPTQAGLIEMGQEAQRHVGLQVAPATATLLADYLQVTGTVQPVDSRVAHVRPLARGRLADVAVTVGTRVTAGQTLARLDNIEAGELAAQVAVARAELERRRVQVAAQARQVERTRRLVELGASPQKELEVGQAEQQALAASVRAQEGEMAGLEVRLRRLGVNPAAMDGVTLTAIRAPFAGVVTKVDASPGEVVDSERELFTIADLSQVWVQAEVYEKDLGRLRLSQPAMVRVDTYPDAPFTGRVTYVSDLLDPETRTARVRVVVANPGARLKLDMFAAVQLPTDFQRQVVAAPVGAVQQVEGKNVVFVRKGAARFEMRAVETGRRVGDTVEIAKGLAAGEPIVTQGAFHLKSIVVGKELGEEE